MAQQNVKHQLKRLKCPKTRVVIDGVYRPNERIRSLPSVYEAPDRVVLLKCSKCVERISTSWFWKHPRHGGTFALVPFHGHLPCTKLLGKKCPCRSLDGTDTITDNLAHLDVCDHNPAVAVSGVRWPSNLPSQAPTVLLFSVQNSSPPVIWHEMCARDVCKFSLFVCSSERMLPVIWSFPGLSCSAVEDRRKAA